MPSQVLIFISVILSACGQVAMKMGASALSGKSDVFWMKILQYLTNIPIMVGLALYGISAFVWIAAIEKVQLSYAYPMAALGYVLVALLSVWIFQEPVSGVRLIGLAIIVIGVIVISRS
ncbi:MULTISPECIES: SMR family transporter [Brevibacillus]|uniref:Cation/cationic drug transporter n=3 Tax=Brevibacillus laterosporus TaxID=1465 RepID=A0AAP3DGI2_BRELA|nr:MULTISPECIES: SMR family transporter [Brevibacillus]ATO48082.1 cation/cationic drug transporter [Brevibacillus laterosporus DSM 25]AYB37145.1 cation/cationic drug transporter [Brevibacillus laterosporus]MBG9772601.1 cation/cationic drug transporter [Brevibacillus laterosporus]MBG9788228.1 cation/cationic drug transporter [Brevibacillus laterosporus]MBG9799826.1 cation/cationic drug transporter [Brevibacillus laterosporus]